MYKYDIRLKNEDKMTFKFVNPIHDFNLKYLQKSVLASLVGATALAIEDWHEMQSNVFTDFYCGTGESFETVCKNLLDSLPENQEKTASSKGILVFCGFNELTMYELHVFLKELTEKTAIGELLFVQSDKYFEDERFISFLGMEKGR